MATAVTMSKMTLKPGADLDEVVAIFSGFIAGVQAHEPGVLMYHYYIDEDPAAIRVIEAYDSSESHVDHYAKLDMAAVGRLLELVDLSDAHYFGDPNDGERAILAGFPGLQYHRSLISIENAAV